ncbi:MAG: hypothetical protein ACHP7N_13455 [Caulobacterales bacterium]
MPAMPGMDAKPAAPAAKPQAAPAANNAPTSDDDDEKPLPGMVVDKMDMPGMDLSGAMMAGDLGAYTMMRDASGTSWQPESTPMEGISGKVGGWTGMLHGDLVGVYDHQGGPRGGDKTFSESMLMVMGQRAAGPGILTLRAMLSLEPLMGKDGYPLMLQTGETANGVTPLVDRQHPHDLFMELAGVYSQPIGQGSSVFVYVGYPGEPALGPPAFMHRFSGMDDPAAPITHHWLDSTHITYGVVTLGFVHGAWKLEGSAFNGREPDQFRWNFDPPRLNSYAARISWNPTSDWALQLSYGFIKSPEQLEPATDQRRVTASATYNRKLAGGNWQTTLAWGRNYNAPGPVLDAFLLESAVTFGPHTLFARAESVQKNELFLSPSPLAGQTFQVSTASLGYIYDVPVAKHLALGLGALASVYGLPSAIQPAYGGEPTSYMAFMRLKIR